MDIFWIIALVTILSLVGGFLAGVLWQARKAPVGSVDLADKFEHLSLRALQHSSEQLSKHNEHRMSQLNEVLAQQKDSSTQSLSALVTPVSTALSELRVELDRLQRETKLTHGSMHEHLRQVQQSTHDLQTQTQSLVGALNSSNTRGRWGEVQLRRIVEAAGMIERVDFMTQDQISGSDGAARPDMVIRLAGGKHIVLDAKVPLSAFLQTLEEPDPATREQLLTEHAKQLRQQVQSLSKKRYWTHYDNAPEFVVLFLPNESLLSQAIAADPDLFDYAMERQIVMATPSTLLAMLRTIGFAWQQEALAKNSQDILHLGRQLYERLCTVGNHLGDVGKKINQSAQSYNKLIGSLETRLLPTAREFSSLGVSQQEFPSPDPITDQSRDLTAREFLKTE